MGGRRSGPQGPYGLCPFCRKWGLCKARADGDMVYQRCRYCDRRTVVGGAAPAARATGELAQAAAPAPEAETEPEEETLFCVISLCEWEAVHEVERPDGSISHLCAQCFEAYEMGLTDGQHEPAPAS